MRKIDTIIIHCSAVRPYQTSSAAEIDRWHKEMGWKSIGYHFVIRRDGSVEAGRPVREIGAHCKGHNAHSIGVCYEGGLNFSGEPADTRTQEQKSSLTLLLHGLKQTYPKAQIYGHKDFNSHKACPCFDAHSEYSSL